MVWLMLKDKTCIEPGCKTRPNYNNPDEKTALYCSEHKKDGMVDVKNKTCIEQGCKTQPNFNNPDEKIGLYCSVHKKDGMVNVINKTCIEQGCKTQPTYNNEGEKTGLYCSVHKKDGMVNVISKTCKSEWCDTIPTDKYDGYCLFCYVNLFPDKPIVRNYKTKEKDVVDKIKEKFPNFTWIHDKKIQNGCSKKRPDLLLDMGTHIIIVEIDENAHTNYDCSCENKRLMEISQDLGFRPIVFIRFNPDDYIDKDGNKIKSCWKINRATGLVVIDSKKIKEWMDRINSLLEQINYWIKNSTNKTIEIIQLFYDENKII